MLNKFEYSRECLIGIVILLWLYWLWTRRHFYRFSMKLPCNWGVPILGMVTQVSGVDAMLIKCGEVFEAYKSYNVCAWFGIKPLFLTIDVETIEQVLTSPDLLNKADLIYRPILYTLGPGLVANPAKKWQHNRKLINPSFHHKVLVGFFPVFHRAKERIITKFNNLNKTQAHHIFDMLLNTTVSVSAETTMGIQLDETKSENDKIVKCMKSILARTMVHIVWSSMGIGALYKLSPFYQKLRETLIVFVRKLLDTKLSEVPKTATQTEICENEDMKKTPNIFIDNAIKIYQQQQFSYEDIIGESNNIVIAAFETSANAVFSTIVMLALHADVQERLFDEVCTVFPERDFRMEYEHLAQLPYLDMVVNEVLRLAPPIPLMARHVTKSVTLKNNLKVPKDVQILMSIFHLHRRKDIWGPNADKFNPDNFLPENLHDKHPYAYIPFSKGARNCIGWRYALFFVKVVITGLVRNFKFSTDVRYEDLHFVANIAIKYKKEPKIQLQPR